MSTLFVGIGTMGAPMVRHYARAFDTIIHDANPEALGCAPEIGARAAHHLDEVDYELVDTVIVIVPATPIVEDILTGSGRVFERLHPGSLVIDMSSSVPASTRALAQRLADLGSDLVDAPVSGGRIKAETGELSTMVGGSDEAVERARAHLAPMTSTVMHVGPAGAGHAAKALNNLLSATNIAAAAEVLTVAARHGIQPDVMVDVINASTGRSQATEVKYPRHILTGQWDSGFSLDLMVKDLGIARDLAENARVQSPITAAAAELARDAQATLGPGRDHTELVRHIENETGTALRSTRP